MNKTLHRLEESQKDMYQEIRREYVRKDLYDLEINSLQKSITSVSTNVKDLVKKIDSFQKTALWASIGLIINIIFLFLKNFLEK